MNDLKKDNKQQDKQQEVINNFKIVECKTCGGSDFSGIGTGYDSVCDNCGGKGEHPDFY